jgi:hypothetical protein
VGDRFARVLAGLERNRAELWQDTVLVGDRRDVTECVHLRVIGEAELWADGDAVSPLELDPERAHELVSPEAGAPDERVRVEHGPGLERDPSG